MYLVHQNDLVDREKSHKHHPKKQTVTPQQFVDYLANTRNLKPSQAVLKACELLGVTKSLFYKWLNGTKNPHPGKLDHMVLIIKNDALEKYTDKMEQYLTNKIKKQSMDTKKPNAKDEVIEKLIKYNAEHPGPFPEYPQIKRVDWYATNDERDIGNIQAIHAAGLKDSIIVTVNGSLRLKDPEEDVELKKTVAEIIELMQPLRTETDDSFAAAPWKTQKIIVYLKYPKRVIQKKD